MNPSIKSRYYKYYFSLLPGIAVVSGNLLGGWWGASNLVFSIGILGLLEWFAPEDKTNEETESDILPTVLLMLHIAMQILALSSLFFAITGGYFSIYQLLVASVSTGIHSGSSSIVIAHELIHRSNMLWKFLGKFLLFTAGNIYFYIEHLRVHHKWVGTEKDPATAHYNESLYHFFFRTTYGQITHAFKLESQRLQKRNLFYRIILNQVVQNIFLQIAFFILLLFTFGKLVLIGYIVQAVIANFLLEYTNYIEHYGLIRNENERVNETHSWQSDKVISRFFLIDLSRHSDHHYFASRPFHQLKTHARSPVLPTGYVTGIYLALLPPLWFKFVNKRIEDFKIQANN